MNSKKDDNNLIYVISFIAISIVFGAGFVAVMTFTMGNPTGEQSFFDSIQGFLFGTIGWALVFFLPFLRLVILEKD